MLSLFETKSEIMWGMAKFRNRTKKSEGALHCCVFVIQDENFSLRFIVVKEKESKKATSRQRKINI